jgi:hypothetical protein
VDDAHPAHCARDEKNTSTRGPGRPEDAWRLWHNEMGVEHHWLNITLIRQFDRHRGVVARDLIG